MFPYLVATLSFSSDNLRFISIWLVIVSIPNSEIFHDLEPDNQRQKKNYLLQIVFLSNSEIFHDLEPDNQGP